MAKRWGARAYIESSSLLNINVKHGNLSNSKKQFNYCVSALRRIFILFILNYKLVFDTAIVTYFQPMRPKKSVFKKLFACGWSRF